MIRSAGCSLGAQPPGEVAAEERVQRAHPGRGRGRRRRRRRVDPEHRDAAGDEVLEHVAVVARDLDHERAAARARAARSAPAALARACASSVLETEEKYG